MSCATCTARIGQPWRSRCWCCQSELQSNRLASTSPRRHPGARQHQDWLHDTVYSPCGIRGYLLAATGGWSKNHCVDRISGPSFLSPQPPLFQARSSLVWSRGYLSSLFANRSRPPPTDTLWIVRNRYVKGEEPILVAIGKRANKQRAQLLQTYNQEYWLNDEVRMTQLGSLGTTILGFFVYPRWAISRRPHDLYFLTMAINQQHDAQKKTPRQQ